MRHIPSQKAGKSAAFALGALAVIAPQLLGGATDGTLLGVLGLAALACMWTAYVLRDHSNMGVLPVASLGAILAAVWTGLQLAPLPCVWLGAPDSERLSVMRELVDLGALRALRCTLTFAPGATKVALAMAAAIAAVVVSAVGVARAGHRRPLATSVALSSIAMAAVGLVHASVDATSVYGLYTPESAKPGFLLAPLLNGNHFAGHMALGFPMCLALATGARRIEWRILWAVGAFTVLTAGLLTLSRGGAGALAFGGVTFALSHALRRARRRGALRALWPLLGVGSVIALACVVAIHPVLGEFAKDGNGLDKLHMAARLFALTKEHPWVGIGRGALADRSTATLELDAQAIYAENLPTQWSVEWGIPLSALLAATFAYSLLRSQTQRSSTAALTIGLVAIVLQNLVDFSLELAGPATCAAVAFGCVIGREPSPPQHVARWLPGVRHALWFTTLGALLALIGPSFEAVSGGRSAARKSIATSIEHGGAPLSLLQQQLNSYPIDPVLILFGAHMQTRQRHPSAGRWLNLAMRVAPGWAAPHLIAADALERRGQLTQSAYQLSAAADRDLTQGSLAACKLLARHPSPQLAFSAVALAPAARQASFERLVDCLAAHHFAEAESVNAGLLAEFPLSRIGRRMELEAMARRGDGDGAVRAAERLRTQSPSAPANTALLMETLVRFGRGKEALGVAGSAPEEVRLSLDVLRASTSAAAQAGDAQGIEAATDALLTRHGKTTTERAQIHATARDAYTRIADHVKAVSHAQAAYDLTHEPATAEALYRCAKRAGLLSVALRVASELCQVRYRGEDYCSARVGVTELQ